MVDWVRAVYFYCHLIGLSNFEFDWRTGRVFTSWRSTLYFITTNFALFTGLVYCWTNFNVIFESVNKLHSNVGLALISVRIMAGVLIVLNRWHRRTQIMNITRTIIRLILDSPEMNRFFRWSIFFKIFLGFAYVFLKIALFVEDFDGFNYDQVLSFILQCWTSAIINLAIFQSYLVLLFVRAQYHNLSTELRKVIEESRSLSRLPYRRAFIMTRCCDLADQMDNIAKLRSQLQWIVIQMGEIFGIQRLMVYGINYLASVYLLYLIYIFLKYGQVNMKMSTKASVLVFTSSFVYYMDVFVNISSMLNVLDDDKEILRQMEERTLFGSVLDVRLEQSFESLQLEMARNPVEINVMNLFSVSRIECAAMLGSIITHSIVLIQYDIENY